jgi:hypothetical protein
MFEPITTKALFVTLRLYDGAWARLILHSDKCRTYFARWPFAELEFSC